MKNKVNPYQTGPKGDYELLHDLGAASVYLMEMARVLHGRIFPAMTYGRSLLTLTELEERLSWAVRLMEALSPLRSLWEMIGSENGQRLPLDLASYRRCSDETMYFDAWGEAPPDE